MAASATRRPAGSATLSERMAHAIAEQTWQGIATPAADKAKLCLLDYLSCAMAAHGLPWSRQAVTISTDNGSGDASGGTVIGTPYRVSTHDAAFSNAVLGHALVRDDMHVGSVSHLGVVVLPVLLALAEWCRTSDVRDLPRAHVTGEELLTAIVCGYEVGGKIGRAILDVDVARVFRPTGIAGPVGAAAGAAKLLGLDAAATAHALAIAANTVSGYNEWAATGGSEMFFHVGFAARNAVTAAQLAAVGAYASRTALDGPAGLLAAFDRPARPDVPGLFDDGPEILSVFFKPVPACNFAQSPAQAAQSIARDHRPDPASIERVIVGVTRAAAAYPGCDAVGPFEHVLQAKMSIHHNVATALVTGGFDEAHYRPGESSEIARIAAATRLEIDDDLSAAYPARQGARVTVELRDGTLYRHSVRDVVPASDDEVRERFLAAAEARIGREQAQRVLDGVMELESADDAAELVRLTRTGADGGAGTEPAADGQP